MQEEGIRVSSVGFRHANKVLGSKCHIQFFRHYATQRNRSLYSQFRDEYVTRYHAVHKRPRKHESVLCAILKCKQYISIPQTPALLFPVFLIASIIIRNFRYDIVGVLSGAARGGGQNGCHHLGISVVHPYLPRLHTAVDGCKRRIVRCLIEAFAFRCESSFLSPTPCYAIAFSLPHR